MRITKSELKNVIKGFGLAIGSWFIVLPLRDYLIKVLPFKPFYMGIAIILIVLFFDN